MSEETLIKQCAPTLAGIKTGSLYICPFQEKKTLTLEIRQFNQTYVPKGLCLIPLRIQNQRALLYLFRPKGLKQDLNNNLVKSLLNKAGYPDTFPDCISCLSRRFRQREDFPHEVGLFLNYPPEDVEGFIKNHASNYKYSGMWKVYGDVEKAQNMFRAYKKCTEIYCRLWQRGMSMEQLITSEK